MTQYTWKVKMLEQKSIFVVYKKLETGRVELIMKDFPTERDVFTIKIFSKYETSSLLKGNASFSDETFNYFIR